MGTRVTLKEITLSVKTADFKIYDYFCSILEMTKL
jgi:hypothetical protein